MSNVLLHCRNCGKETTGNFCSDCGQPNHLKRIDFRYVLDELRQLFEFEKGLLYTAKELLLRPGATVKEFITYNRSRLVKPLLFLILTSVVYSLIDKYFHIIESHVNNSKVYGQTSAQIFGWVQDNFGYANIIEGVIIALWIKILFKKYKYNFYEILILICFVGGIGMILSSIFILAEGLFKTDLFTISNIAAIAFGTWAIGQFFDAKKPVAYIKALLANIIGTLSFSLIILILGALLDRF